MASIIDPTLAKSLIKEFQQQNASVNGPAIKTPDGHYLNGFFIDRESLEIILKNSNVVGISVSFAKHPDFQGAKDNIFTIALTGAEPNNDPNLDTPYVSNGDIFDFMPPCPPYCTTLV